MFGLGFGELILIFLIALIFIGPKKLPELAKGLGQGIKEFQKAAKGFTDQIQESGSDNTETKTQHEQNQIAADATQQQSPDSEKKPETKES